MRYYFLYFIFCVFLPIVLFETTIIESINLTDVFSLIIFICSLIISLIKYNYFIFFLLFNIIAMPAAVNNFIPGVFFGFEYEIGAATIPLFTFFDIFCFLGIFRYRLKASFNKKYLIISLLVGCLLVFIVNVFILNSFQEFLLLISGLWQLRYILHLFIISQNLSKISFRLIYNSLVFSTLFLIFESIIFSYLNGLSNLTSGSLGVNSFGNLLSAIILFAIFSREKIGNNKNYFNLIFIVIVFVCMILTETRSAVLSLLLVSFFMWLKTNRIIKLFIFSGVMFFSYNSLPSKYQIFSQLSFNQAIDILEDGYDFASNEQIDVDTSNSSIITRLKLIRTSKEMISDNIFFGVGPRLWNYKKYQYDFDEYVLIDSHNGYLSFISEYGLIVGSLFIILFLYPLMKINYSFKFWPLIAFTYLFVFSEFSNSGTYKNQIFSILFLVSLIFYNQNFSNENSNSGN